jgi:hypothetical protein
MIGTAMLPLNLVCVIVVEPTEDPKATGGPTIVAAQDGRAAAEAALAHDRAAVWVGPVGSPAYEEFRDEIGRAR